MMMGRFLLLIRAVLVLGSISCSSSLSTATQKKASSSNGEAIQLASSQEELLNVASQFWLPTDQELAPHLRSQRVHHEKRQRWSAQLLEKMGASPSRLSTDLLLEDDRMQRAVLAASIPFELEADRPSKEGRYVRQALCGIHAVVGGHSNSGISVDTLTLEGIQQLIDRADAMATVLPLPHVVEMRWAARGILALLFDPKNLKLPHMDERVLNLPFDITPRGVDWKRVASSSDAPSLSSAVVLKDAIPFRFDTITTRTGAAVVERRGTAWQAEEGIGALAYSGKLMPPKALSTVVSDTMRAVERAIGMPEPFFDCALCNHYPDAEAACKFHTDPEHGTLWERLTCVVAAGDSRRFAFRPIPGSSQWSKWEQDTMDEMQQEETLPAVVHLFSGDIVQMWGECNDLFHHAVYTADGDNQVSPDGRVSLVLKRAIDRGGTRGHGLQGQGRRSKRNNATPLSSVIVSDRPSTNRSRRRRRK